MGKRGDGGEGRWGRGGGRDTKVFLVLIFGQIGFFRIYENRRNSSGWQKKYRTGIIWVLYFSSAQINNDTSAIHCVMWSEGILLTFSV